MIVENLIAKCKSCEWYMCTICGIYEDPWCSRDNRPLFWGFASTQGKIKECKEYRKVDEVEKKIMSRGW